MDVPGSSTLMDVPGSSTLMDVSGLSNLTPDSSEGELGVDKLGKPKNRNFFAEFDALLDNPISQLQIPPVSFTPSSSDLPFIDPVLNNSSNPEDFVPVLPISATFDQILSSNIIDLTK